jgi:glycosyltransferase involved in cell wall biosynthesis
LSLNLIPEKKIDIWHATYPLPLRIKGAKKITTIHDIIPLRLPYTTLDDKRFFYKLIENSLKTSDLIITVSENTKQDLIEFFDYDPNQIVVTYQPIALNKKTISEDQLSIYLRKYKLENKRYLLFVGAIEPKKNLGRLIEAYALSNLGIPLVIVGKKGWLWEKDLEKISMIFGKDSQQVKILEYVPFADLPYLYKGASCFIFPSLYEGFGLPPLEAMNFDCPVITSNVSSLPEICGDGALYIDPYDVNDIAEKITRLIYDRELRNRLSQGGKERVEFFSFDNYLLRLANAYQKLL